MNRVLRLPEHLQDLGWLDGKECKEFPRVADDFITFFWPVPQFFRAFRATNIYRFPLALCT